MSKITVSADLVAKLKHFSDAGDVQASILQSLLASIRTLDLTAAAENANTIAVTGQVRDAEGNAIAAVVDVILTSFPIAGAGTLTLTTGTVKVGSGTKQAWIQTDATGKFVAVIANVVAEDNLLVAQLDNGETEAIKVTFA